MRVPYWLSFLSSRRRAGQSRPTAAPRRGRPFRPTFEALEDRSVPSFSPITAYAVGADLRAVVSADFNGDGRLDLALATGDSYNASYPERAAGQRRRHVPDRPVRQRRRRPQSVAVGDFDRDGKPDLVTFAAGPGRRVRIAGATATAPSRPRGLPRSG